MVWCVAERKIKGYSEIGYRETGGVKVKRAKGYLEKEEERRGPV